MSRKPDIDAFYHAYALSIFGWKCLISALKQKIKLVLKWPDWGMNKGIEMAWLGDEQVVYTDNIDGSEWVCCNVWKRLAIYLHF